MARKPAPKPSGTTIPHDWREQVRDWRITAMMGKIADGDYLAEVRRFENHHIAAGTLSADWSAEWRTWCRRRLVERFNSWTPPVVEEPETLGLFSSL